MITWGLVSRLIALLTTLLVAPIAGGSGTPLSAAASSAPAAYTYDASAYVYDAPAQLSSPDIAASYVRGSPSGPDVASWGRSVSTRGCCTAANTAGNAAGAAARPAGVADSFVSEAANSGKGTVWRAPGSSGNAGTVRIMEPTAQYPKGYVRFYNDSGQPIGLNGKPGPNSMTHIPLNPDGTYPLPKNWGG